MFGLLKGKKTPAAPAGDWETGLAWLPPGHAENPFSEEVLDCRSLALTATSTTSDQGVAARYNQLRVSDGREMRGQLPEQALTVECDLRLPHEGLLRDGPVFLAREMEDKWDFFLHDRRLYLRRSWTGRLMHVAELEPAPDAVVVRRIHSEPQAVFSRHDFAAAQVRFLIASHLRNAVRPYPIPPELPRDDRRSIALLGFSAYGRRAQFAAYLGPVG